MKKRQAGKGSRRKRSTPRVGGNRSQVKAFEVALTDEFSRARKTFGRDRAAFDRWAVRKMARVMTLAVNLAQRKAGRG